MNQNRMCELDSVIIADARVISGLKQYLDKCLSWPFIDKYQEILVYINADMDFTAFESIAYKVSFYSFAHKISETIRSPYEPIRTTLQDFRDYISQM